MAEPSNGAMPALTSKWGGLSQQLIASFFPVRKLDTEQRDDIVWVRDFSEPEVRAPITDANGEITLNWMSSFENIGPDQKFSTLSALLQTGGFTATLEELQKRWPSMESLDGAAGAVRTLDGKSNLTKLNSMQVFQGMPPVKFTMTAHFRAFENAVEEVERPMDKLIEWALPQKIASMGVLNSLAKAQPSIFSSEIPRIIGMTYANRTIMPLVIESMPVPLSGPRGRDGALHSATLAMQLGTLTAIDRADWLATRRY